MPCIINAQSSKVFIIGQSVIMDYIKTTIFILK